MSGGALVVVVALSLFAASLPVGLWLRRTPSYRSIPRPTPWMVTEADALKPQERAGLTKDQRKIVDRADARGVAVDDPVLALAAYRTARASSAEERRRLTSYTRGLFVPAFLGFGLLCPGLVQGRDWIFGKSGIADSVLLLLFASTFVAEAVRSTRALRRSERAEELNCDLIPAEVRAPAPPELRSKRSRLRSGV